MKFSVKASEGAIFCMVFIEIVSITRPIRMFYATDAPGSKASNRRKPGVGMINEAQSLFARSSRESIFIGDSITDMMVTARTSSLKEKNLQP